MEQLIASCPEVTPFGAARERAERDCRLLRVDSVHLGEEVDWGMNFALWGGALLAVTAVGILLGVLLGADSMDGHCDLDCPP